MPEIEEYGFGRVVIDGREYTSDVIVFPGRIKAGWRRKVGHGLHPEDIQDIIEAKPELLIIGTGASGCMQVPEVTARFIRGRGIRLRVQRTGEACETYNREGGRAVAALHLTC